MKRGSYQRRDDLRAEVSRCCQVCGRWFIANHRNAEMCGKVCRNRKTNRRAKGLPISDAEQRLSK